MLTIKQYHRHGATYLNKGKQGLKYIYVYYKDRNKHLQ